MTASIIIPFHKNIGQLQASLVAARRSMPDAEIIVAADGAVENCGPLALRHDAVVIEVAGPSGPAVARNRAAAVATGDILLFVDADVVVAEDALPGMCQLLEERPDLAGVFGAYDLEPLEQNFMSQFKNLSHAWIHERASGEASTFWAGLGAIRRSVFWSAGGFDERFTRPSVEDIDLGCRVVAEGHTLRLDPRFRGQHLKRWTFRSIVATDILARGIPWTQLLRRFGSPRNGLNLSRALRWSVGSAYLLIVSLACMLISPWSFFVAGAALVALVGLNYDYYQWLSRRRGLSFGLRALLVHIVHHLCNGLSFVIGTVLSWTSRAGWRLPGALPSTCWEGGDQVRGMAGSGRGEGVREGAGL